MAKKADKVQAKSRKSTVRRQTRETKIELTLNLDGTGKTEIATGLGFLDHMLTQLAFHGKLDLQVSCRGDLEIDDHHTVEDVALTLGEALDQALAERQGIMRFGFAYAPLDEALVRVVLDFSGRAFAVVNLGLEREKLGDVSCENLEHFFFSLANAARMTIHVDLIRGANDHHKVEAAFKALALALRQAVAKTAGNAVASTKGKL